LVFNWTSGNEKIDDFIQETQFEANNPVIVYVWIPYNQFNKIKKIGKGGFSTIYLAIWKNNRVALKCLDNSQILVNELLNEV
jgi:serine/threonine protein kinase